MTKLTDSIKYIGKNFWKVLPVGSSLNYRRKNKDKLEGREYDAKDILHDFYALAGVFALSGYLGTLSLTKEWEPKKQLEEIERIKVENQKEEDRKMLIEKKYNGIFESENPQTFQDSLNIYLKYGLPIKLLSPSFEQREEAVNKLEKSVEEAK